MITVVSGLPRSGTSVMMQMLAAGGLPMLTDGIRAADENNPRGYYEWEPARRLAHEPGRVAEAEGKAVKIISSLLLSLPGDRSYRVVFMRRPLDEVVASQAAMIKRLEAKGAGLPPAAMKTALEAHLRQVDSWLARQLHIQVCPVEYRKLLDEARNQAARVAQFLGADLDIDAMARQVDRSLHHSVGQAGQAVSPTPH